VEQFLGGNSKFSELAMVRMVNYGTAKERKVLCKALKGCAVELSQRECRSLAMSQRLPYAYDKR